MTNNKYNHTGHLMPYENIAGIAQLCNLTPRTVQTKITELKKEIQLKTYSDYAVISNGKIVLIHIYVFMHFLSHQKQLANKNMRKYVPPYSAHDFIPMFSFPTNSSPVE